MDQLELRGVIPPVVTAIDAEGRLDVKTQSELCRWHLNEGAAAIFVAGTTGEGAAITESMFTQLVETAVKSVAGRLPVLAGVLAPSADLAISRAVLAETAGASAVVATAPFYGQFSPAEVEQHFRRIADGSPLPVLAYSIPSMTNQPMALEVVEALFADDVVLGLKDSGHDVAFLTAAIEIGKALSKAVYSGFEPLAATALLAGASGVVATTGNLDPAGFSQLWQAAQSGQWDQVEFIHRRLRRMVQDVGALVSPTFGPLSAVVAGTKAGLELLGRMPGRAVLPPLSELPSDALVQVRQLLTRAGLL